MNLKLQSILINFISRILLYSPFFKDLSSEDAIRLLKGSLAKPPKEEGSVRYTQSELNPSLPPLSRTSKRSYHSDIRNTTNTKPTTQQFSMKNKRLNALRKKKPAYCQPSTAFQSTPSPPPSSNKKSKPNTPKYQQPTSYKRPNPHPQSTQYWSSSSYNNNNNNKSNTSSSPLKAIERIYYIIYLYI